MSNDNTYRYLGGDDIERVQMFSMFSAAGTDAAADILENALDGASVGDLRRMLDAAAADGHGEIFDTAVREELIYSLPGGSLAQHTLADAYGDDIYGGFEGVADAGAASMIVSAARTEALERV